MRWIIVSAVAILLILFCMGGCAISYHNKAIDLESQFNAVQTDNESQFDNMKKKIISSGKVTKAQADIIEKVIIKHAEARGGSGGMTLVNAVHESVPTVPVETFTNLQNIINGSRDKFTACQSRLLDIKREHDALRGKFPSSLIVGGRPELVAQLITSTVAKEAMETGTDDDMSIGLE